MVMTEEKPVLKVVRQSDFIASCSCEDFFRHKDYEQTQEEFLGRKGRSKGLRVVGFDVRYGAVVVATETRDKRGCRQSEVMLSRGDGDPFVCKHIVRALRTKALMPEYLFKTVVFSEKAARNLARLYAGKLRKRGRQPDVVVTACNNAHVVGWRRVNGR